MLPWSTSQFSWVPIFYQNSQNIGQTPKILGKLPKYWPNSQFLGQSPIVLGKLPQTGKSPKILGKLPIFCQQLEKVLILLLEKPAVWTVFYDSTCGEQIEVQIVHMHRYTSMVSMPRWATAHLHLLVNWDHWLKNYKRDGHTDIVFISINC